MQIVPVLDILDGKVVHGKAGDRSSYKPIESRLVDSASPLQVLQAMTQATGSSTAYIADLNGLMFQQPQSSILKSLTLESVDLMVDAGIQTAAELDGLPNDEQMSIVLASESIRSEEDLRNIVSEHKDRRFAFSFDFIDDQLRSPITSWCNESLPRIADLVWRLGIQEWIVLDVRSVGMSGGPTTLNRCRQLLQMFCEVKITAGGGVRDVSDLAAFGESGVTNVLVATALHQGTLSGGNFDFTKK